MDESRVALYNKENTINPPTQFTQFKTPKPSQPLPRIQQQPQTTQQPQQQPQHHSRAHQSEINVGGGGGNARGNNDVLEFQTEFLKNIIEGSLENFQSAIHRDVQNLHLELIRQFHIQQKETERLLAKYAETQQFLLDEIESLREENERLKNIY